jgi:hypothetical protein
MCQNKVVSRTAPKRHLKVSSPGSPGATENPENGCAVCVFGNSQSRDAFPEFKTRTDWQSPRWVNCACQNGDCQSATFVRGANEGRAATLVTSFFERHISGSSKSRTVFASTTSCYIFSLRHHSPTEHWLALRKYQAQHDRK